MEVSGTHSLDDPLERPHDVLLSRKIADAPWLAEHFLWKILGSIVWNVVEHTDAAARYTLRTVFFVLRSHESPNCNTCGASIRWRCD
jgi:hypothetical protein